MEPKIRNSKGTLLLSLLIGLAILGIASVAVVNLVRLHSFILAQAEARTTEQQVKSIINAFLLESKHSRNLIAGDNSVTISRQVSAAAFPGIQQARHLPDPHRSVVIRYRSLNTSILLSPALPPSFSHPVFCSVFTPEFEAASSPTGTGLTALTAKRFWLMQSLNGELCFQADARRIEDPRCGESGVMLVNTRRCDSRVPISRISRFNALHDSAFLDYALVVANLRDVVAIYLDRIGCLRRYSALSLTHQPLFCGDKRTKLTAVDYKRNTLRWLTLRFRRNPSARSITYHLPIQTLTTQTQLHGALLNAIL